MYRFGKRKWKVRSPDAYRCFHKLLSDIFIYVHGSFQAARRFPHATSKLPDWEIRETVAYHPH